MQAQFKISSGLKNIIGQDLITNDYVAIFELVKNAYDAAASVVRIYFKDDRIYIIDNGKGMSSNDIDSKWLFVAYSAKKDGTEDSDLPDKIYAGSKGVGRFSCDRLGGLLKLQTRSQDSKAVEIVEVDWNDFDIDLHTEFEDIGVTRRQAKEFKLPDGIKTIDSGTILEISDLREGWSRDKLLILKGYLSKLINPIEGISGKFSIYLYAESEKEIDQKAIGKKRAALFTKGDLTSDQKAELRKQSYNDTVNGKIQNFVFRELDNKTTRIDVKISEDGSQIETELNDRGELIYRIREPNIYKELSNSSLSVSIYYLNTSAKNTFTRRTGMKPIKFGSIFLFRNGFRVFPVGEPDDDTFGLDRRKQQGYARFLGTRELIGRIDVKGSEIEFKESTSRDHGLIETRSYSLLRDFIWEYCIKRLENYVVGVSWEDKLDADYETPERLKTDANKARISAILSKLVNSEEITIVFYNKDIVSIISEKSEQFESSLKNLRIVAAKTNDQSLNEQISIAERRFKEIQEAELFARAQAEEERKARREAERAALNAQLALTKAKEEEEIARLSVEEERKRTLYLTALTSIDHDNLLKLNHQIDIYAAEVHHILLSAIKKAKNGYEFTEDDLLSTFERILFRNQQIVSTSRIITRANFRMDSELIDGDIVQYMDQYIKSVCNQYIGANVNIETIANNSAHIRKFRPIEIAMLIDNLVSNAHRAKADRMVFKFSKVNSKILQVDVIDDGRGFGKQVDRSRIWEKGYTMTEGSGLGLFHVAEIIQNLGASIDIIEGLDGGAGFRMRIPQ